MKPRLNFSLCLLSSISGLLTLSGCNILPEAQADPTRFFVLSTPAVAPLGSPAKGPTVHLRPVELASYIKAKPIIVRRGDNEIEFREYARWGEPLELGIGRVLREELLARGAARAVLISGLRAFNVDYDYDYRNNNKNNNDDDDDDYNHDDNNNHNLHNNNTNNNNNNCHHHHNNNDNYDDDDYHYKKKKKGFDIFDIFD